MKVSDLHQQTGILVPNYIGGDPVVTSLESLTKQLRVTSYFDENKYFLVPSSDLTEMIQAVQWSKKALPLMCDLSSEVLLIIFQKILDFVKKNKDDIAKVEALYQGTYWKFQQEFSLGPILNLTQEFIKKLESLVSFEASIPTNHSASGVIAVIVPRALSFYEVSWRILYSLFHKNAAIIKVSSDCAISSLIWQLLLQEIPEIPKGTVQFLQGEGKTVGEFITQHPSVSAIAFAGSDIVGEKILKQTGALSKKYQFFMNGKNSVVVLNDLNQLSDVNMNMNMTVNPDELVSLIMKPAINMKGLMSYSPQRFLVLESQEASVKENIKKYLEQIPYCDSFENFGFLPLKPGELIKFQQFKMQLKSEGAKVLFENDRFCFLYDLPNCSEFHQLNSELPIFTLNSVKYQHEFSKWINNSSYGHSLIIWGDSEKAKKVFLKSDVGLTLNNPNQFNNILFTPMKSSFYGNGDINIPSSFFSNFKKFM